MFPGNVRCGIYADESVASLTITGNRIEWNNEAGIWCRNAYRLSLVGNTIDYSGCIGMHFEDANALAISGNVFWRSGCPFGPIPPELASDPHANAHAPFTRCRGVAFSGNVLHAGLHRDVPGAWRPRHGLVLEGLAHSAFTGNSLWGAGAASPSGAPAPRRPSRTLAATARASSSRTTRPPSPKARATDAGRAGRSRGLCYVC